MTASYTSGACRRESANFWKRSMGGLKGGDGGLDGNDAPRAEEGEEVVYGDNLGVGWERD